MTTLTLQIDNDTALDNLKKAIRLMKGITIIPKVDEKALSADYKKDIDLRGIGGAWASEDFPTAEELRAMRKSSHKVTEL